MGQTICQIYIHAVFSTKHREPIIADAWRNELFRVLGGAVNNLGCRIIIVGGVADHVHMLFALSNTKSVADVMGPVKATSSAWVNQTQRPAYPFRWQGGYAAFSLSHSHIAAARRYIENQPAHHADRPFEDEIRELVIRYEADFKEEFLLD